MRLVCALAIAFWLVVPALGIAWRQEPAAPETPAVNAPAQGSPDADKAAGDTADKNSSEKTPSEKTPTVAAPVSSLGSATRKRRRHLAPSKDGGPQKIVVREGGAKEPAAQIAPDITPAQALQERQNAEQLLASTDDHLKQLAGRSLDARQQESMGQIRNYVAGTRSALKEGDVRRASTLAQKAHLLAEDLVKH